MGRLQSGIAKKDEMSEIRERLAHVESAGRKVEDIATQIQKIQEDIGLNKSSGQSTSAAVDSLKGSYQLLVERVAAAEGEISSIEKAVHQSSDGLESKLVAQISSMEQSFRDESKSTHSDMKELSSTVSGISNLVGALDGTVQVLRERSEVFQSSSKDSKSALTKHQQDITKLQHQLSTMQSELQNDSDVIKELKKDISRANDRLDNFQLVPGMATSTRSTYPQGQHSARADDTDDESVTIGRDSRVRAKTPPRNAMPDLPIPRDYDSDVEDFPSHNSSDAEDAVEDNEDSFSAHSPRSRSRKATGASLTVRGVMKKSEEAGKSIGMGRSVVDDMMSLKKSPVRSARESSPVPSTHSSDIESIEQIETIDKEELQSPVGAAPNESVQEMSYHSSSDNESPHKSLDNSSMADIPTLDDPSDALSSTSSSPLKQQFENAPSKIRDFMSSLDNSFDESADLTTSIAPSRPQGSPSPSKDNTRSPLQRRRSGELDSPNNEKTSPIDTSRSFDDQEDELPVYRPEIAAALMKEENESDDIVGAHECVEQDSVDLSEDRIKSFSIVSSDDGGAAMNQSRRTIDSLALSDDSTDSIKNAKKGPTPGKLPKSSSDKFSHELEDVVSGYWKKKNGDSNSDDDVPTKSGEPTDIKHRDETQRVTGSSFDDDDDSDWDRSPTKPIIPRNTTESSSATTPKKSDREYSDSDEGIDDDEENLMSGKNVEKETPSAEPAADPTAGLSIR